MPKTLLIKNPRIVSSAGITEADVLIAGQIISRIAPSLPPNADDVIDATGLHLLPGAIDCHVHFREPGAEYKENLETGSMACSAGGVTGFFDMPNTSPSTTSAAEIRLKKVRAADTSLVNYNFFIGAVGNNLADCNEVKNIPGIKLYLGSTTGSLLLDQMDYLEQLFAEGDRLIAVHAEDNAILKEYREFAKQGEPLDHLKARPVEAAMSALKLVIGLSKKYKRRLHVCHVSSRAEAVYLAEHRDKLITAEVTPQHILLNAPEIYERIGTFAQINPPIREASDREALYAALKNGAIDMVATDHAPHSIVEKKQPYGKAPSGMPGVETLLPLLLDQANQGNCKLEDVVKWTAEKPVELFRIESKGAVREGYDADLVLVDMEQSRKIENGRLVSRCNWSAFDGQTLKGWPLITIVGGNVVYREGEFFKEVKGREIKFSS